MRERLCVEAVNRGKLNAEQTTPRREYRLVTSPDGDSFQRIVYGEWQTINDSQDAASPTWRVTVPVGGKLGGAVAHRERRWNEIRAPYSSASSIVLESFDDLAPYTPIAHDRNVRGADAPSGTTRKGVAHHVELTDEAAPGLTGTAALYTAKLTLNGNDGWSVINRTYDPPLNLADHRGIGLWLRGDGQG